MKGQTLSVPPFIHRLMDLHEIWFHASNRGPHVADKSTSDKTKGHHAATRYSKLWSHSVSKSLLIKLNNIQH